MNASVKDASPITPNPSPTTVLVTGATGYVAGWVVKRLLEAGHTVHAAVRDPAHKDKLAHLDQLAASLPGEMVYFKADLLTPDSYTPAMADCELVFHVASPFTTRFSDARRELVDPAVKGTRNVLDSANATPSVRRVVVTSSCAAIYGDNADLAATANHCFTEANWNTTSTLNHQPYSFSKVEAEKAAWAMAKVQTRWDLVTINPALILGPGTTPAATSESFAILRQMADGTMKMGAPDLRFGVVDVRDVAEAHYRAGFLPSAHGRYITSASEASLLDIATILRQHFGDQWPFPTRPLPKWLLWLVGSLVNKTFTRRMVSRNVGLPIRFDNTRSKTELGLEYRPLSSAVRDMFQQQLDHQMLSKP